MTDARNKYPLSIAKAAEAAAEAYTANTASNSSRNFKIEDVKLFEQIAFKQAVEWLLAHLTSQSVPFDEETADIDSEKYEHDVYMADPDGVDSYPAKHWVDGRRFQHAQSAAREQALRARLDAMQGERIAHIKCAERNEQFIEEIERLRRDLEAYQTDASAKLAQKDLELDQLREKAEALAGALEYAKGQLAHAGYSKNAVPVVDKALTAYRAFKGET